VAFYEINIEVPFKENWYANVAINASVGGSISKMQGGSFGHAFVSAGVSALGNGLMSTGHIKIESSAGRIIASAIIGGTASELSGGKFANGAITAAFQAAAAELPSFGQGSDPDSNWQTDRPDFADAPELQSEFLDMWNDSNPSAPEVWMTEGSSTKHENGGYIIKRWFSDTYDVYRSPPGSRERISLREPLSCF
jgi:hypothetical protein